MNPDKLFDYLDGRLPAGERAELESRLVTDPEFQRELAVARRIHAGMRGESREVVLPEAAINERGRKMALRVGIASIILMAVNLGAALWIIARHESKNPNRKFLEQQTREQIARSLERAAATALASPPSLGVSEIRISAAAGSLDSVATAVVAAANQLGGSATKGIPDEHRVGILVDLPANRETEFRSAIAAISGAAPNAPLANETSAPASGKKSFVVQIIEAAAEAPN